jgi:glutamyl-tRNA synthetase
MEKIRTRIAPSPTGIAHIGTAYMALFNYAFAKKNNGEFIVRIEDTDRQRFVEGAEKVIYDSLRWLGIPYAEAADIGGPHAPYRQSERLHLYKDAAKELLEKGHAYYCFCTQEILTEMRSQQQAKKEIPRYDRRCLRLSSNEIEDKLAKNERHVIRMKMPDNEVIGWNDLIRGHVEINTKELDDQVLMKSDGFPTYHLAVVVDDNAMQISHIIRGEEWISSTPKHILLYRYFGWQLPEFAHMPLLRNPDKSKMSKRKNDVSIPSYKEKGYLPEALRNYLCLLGWSHPEEKDIFDLEEFVKKFSIERMQTTGPIFDIQKLTWMNQHYISELSNKDLKDRLLKYYKDNKSIISFINNSDDIEGLLDLAKSRMRLLSDFYDLVRYMFEPPSIDALNEEHFTVVPLIRQALEKVEDWNKDKIFNAMKEIMQEKRSVKMPLFYVLFTGQSRGLPLPEMLEILTKDETLKRLSILEINAPKSK